MTSFDFDLVPERRGTDSQKWQKYAGRDVLPLWVADMDFKSAAGDHRGAAPARGRTAFSDTRGPVKSTVDAVVDAMQQRYGWAIDPIVDRLAARARGRAERHRAGVRRSRRGSADADAGVSTIHVRAEEQRAEVRDRPVGCSRPAAVRNWEIDWEALERAVTPRTRTVLPVQSAQPARARLAAGRTRAPGGVLRAAQSDPLLGRDSLRPHSRPVACRTFRPALLSPEIAARTITLMAPSKTYNVPGLGTSIAIIPDSMRRARFVRAAAGIVAEVTSLGFAACEAAYRDSEPWRQALIAYLRGNRDYLLDTIARELPGVRVEAPVEATYLLWLNVSALGRENPTAHFEQHGVGLSDGAMFGAPKGSHVRLNFGCPRATLVEAMRRMKSALG